MNFVFEINFYLEFISIDTHTHTHIYYICDDRRSIVVTNYNFAD